MKNILLFKLLVITIFFGCSNPKFNEYSSPINQGISKERLHRIDSYLETKVNETVIPGAVALVSRNGKIVYNKSFGHENPSENIPYNNDHIFRIASMTKAVTSLATIMLWEEGNFLLDDPIEKYIPEFKEMTVLDEFNKSDTTYTTKKAKKKITIRHLLTHTSGIGYGFIDNKESMRLIYDKAGITELYSTENITIEDVVKRLTQLPLHHDPGSDYVYSMGLDVLGYLIEIISGLPLDQFFYDKIFEPLGMNDTYFYVPEEKHNRVVRVLIKKNNNWIDFYDDRFDIDFPKKGYLFFSGGAGLSSTVKDYSKFLEIFINEGETYNGVRLIGKKTCETLFENQLEGIENFEIGLAFGLASEEDYSKGGHGSVGTLSWGGYFNTSYFADPKENIIGIIYKQTQYIEDPTSKAFRELVFQSIID